MKFTVENLEKIGFVNIVGIIWELKISKKVSIKYFLIGRTFELEIGLLSNPILWFSTIEEVEKFISHFQNKTEI